MFFTNCFTRWSKVFNLYKQIIFCNHDSFVIVIIDDENVYVVHYENIILTKIDYDRFNIKRLIIKTKIFEKNKNVKKKIVMKKDFEIRIKWN